MANINGGLLQFLVLAVDFLDLDLPNDLAVLLVLVHVGTQFLQQVLALLLHQHRPDEGFPLALHLRVQLVVHLLLLPQTCLRRPPCLFCLSQVTQVLLS